MQSWAETTEKIIEKNNTYSNDQPSINWSSPDDIKNHMVYKLMPVKGEATFAPNLVLLDPALSKNFSEIYLVRTENFEEGEVFTLYVTALYHDIKWRNYTSVTSPRADDLFFTSITKKVHDCDKNISCQYEEKMSIEIGFIEIIDSLTTNLELNNPAKQLFIGDDANHQVRINTTWTVQRAAGITVKTKTIILSQALYSV